MSDMRLRYLFLYFLAMSSIAPIMAQDVPGSSIISRTFLSPDGARKAVQRVYDNGLGDVVQEIQSYTGTTLPSVIVHHEYDDYRRRTRSLLPVTSSDSLYVSGNTVGYMAQSQYSDTAPFSRTEYDGFLPSQPSAQYKAGAQWQGNGKEVVIRNDKLNEDLSTYNKKLQDRRQKVQDINALMNHDNTIADRLWKMDLTSNDLTKLVKQYDEK